MVILKILGRLAAEVMIDLLDCGKLAPAKSRPA
jgi:hypothetical protein